MKKKFYQLTNKSFKNSDVKTYEELWKKVGKDYEGLSLTVDTEFKPVEDDKTGANKSLDDKDDQEGGKEKRKAKKGNEGKFNIIMSTDKEDRHGEIIKQKWDLKNFKKNPVFLDSHQYSSIEHIIGKINKIKVKDEKLQGEVEFMLDNPKGMLAYKMAKQGFLNATSVGFIPLAFDKAGNIEKSELLEDSAVSVPANAEALFEKVAKSKKTDKEKIASINKMDFEKPVKKRNSRLEAIRKISQREEEKANKRKEILKETLAVIQRLSEEKVVSSEKSKMVNRIIKNMLKIKK